MNKKKEKEKEKESTNEAPPIDYLIENKNLQYTITLKDKEILSLKEQNDKRGDIIKKLEKDYFELKKVCVNNYELEKEIGRLRHSKELLTKDVENLQKEIIIQKTKFLEEKNEMEKLYNSKINQLQTTINSYDQKIETANKIIEENKKLNEKLEELEKEKKELIKKHEMDLVDLEVRNQLKLSNLKKKMLEEIENNSKKVTELNMQYIDASNKLTLVQNYQLLTQLEYQSQQFDELTKKKEILEKKNYELKKDIEIHKEVELSLADKNKRLKNELSTIKEKKNNSNQESEKNKQITIISKDVIEKNDYNKLNINLKMLNLEQKIIDLEKKLNAKKRDFNNLKQKYESIENILKNIEKKYLGLYNFLEDCLNNFFNDVDLNSNREISEHIEQIKNGDFSSLDRDEQYITLIILMKYLIPLINQTKLNNDINSANNLDLKNQFNNNSIKMNENVKFKKIIIKKPKFNHRSISVEDLNNINKVKLPSLPGKSLDLHNLNKNVYNKRYNNLILNKINSSRSRISSTSVGN